MKKRHTLIKLIGCIGERKWLLLGACICAVIGVVSNLVGPFFIGKAIDSMVGINQVNFMEVLRLLLILLVVYGTYAAFTWLLTDRTNAIAYHSISKLRKDLFDKVSYLSLNFHDTNPHGDIISRFVNDIDQVGEGMIQGIATFLTGIVTIIGAIGFMMYISPAMAGVVILSAPLTYMVAKFITKRSKELFSIQAKHVGLLNGYAEEMITGQKTVKAFGYEKAAFKQFEKMNNTLYTVGVQSQFYGSLANPSTRLVNNIVYAVIGMIGSILAIRGKITIGDISSFLIYSTLFAKPFNEITGVFTQIQGAIASANRIFDILDQKKDDQEEPRMQIIKDCKGEIRFEHVDFSYNKDRKLIEDLNLYVKAGSRVAIVGKTGAGKTTLVNLLMRFYEVDRGRITLDGVPITDLDRTSLRTHFGMVLQETFLFSDTIANNIAYGKPGATREEIINAAKEAEAHSFIMRLPQGYDTVLTSAGDSLSQGQKQLLTLARVMLVNPPMLILDEATSNIDTRTEIHIQQAFKKLMQDKTTFIIAHRLSTIREADIILVMENGNIVEQGRHEELLSKEGVYARLYNSQF